jgi:hypothetical protein
MKMNRGGGVPPSNDAYATALLMAERLVMEANAKRTWLGRLNAWLSETPEDLAERIGDLALLLMGPTLLMGPRPYSR